MSLELIPQRDNLVWTPERYTLKPETMNSEYQEGFGHLVCCVEVRMHLFPRK